MLRLVFSILSVYVCVPVGGGEVIRPSVCLSISLCLCVGLSVSVCFGVSECHTNAARQKLGIGPTCSVSYWWFVSHLAWVLGFRLSPLEEQQILQNLSHVSSPTSV